ncbi:MAG TPA: hypothetical protein VHC69_00540 [Polyangiaceae bacterium]|nr:hypothetical protein [Polyangiaceae bacterium]
MPRKKIIGIMGTGHGASPSDVALAEELGELVAREGFVLLTGGREVGIMAAANRGAKRVPSSVTLGISPFRDGANDSEEGLIDIHVFTGMGDGRNVINVLSSDVVVVCGQGGAGTASEAALALKSNRHLVMLGASPEAKAFFTTLGSVHFAETPGEALELVRKLTGE